MLVALCLLLYLLRDRHRITSAIRHRSFPTTRIDCIYPLRLFCFTSQVYKDLFPTAGVNVKSDGRGVLFIVIRIHRGEF